MLKTSSFVSGHKPLVTHGLVSNNSGETEMSLSFYESVDSLSLAMQSNSTVPWGWNFQHDWSVAIYESAPLLHISQNEHQAVLKIHFQDNSKHLYRQ